MQVDSCKLMQDISKPSECEHYSEKYEGGVCPEFVRADDVSKRLFDAVKSDR